MGFPVTFANNFWGADDAGYHRLIQRMHHAKQTTEELLSFYRERQSIEQDYARKLSNLANSPLGQNEYGSLRQSLDTIRATTQNMAAAHETTANQIAAQLFEPLEAFAVSVRERRKTVEDIMAKLTKAKSQRSAAVEKSRDRYMAECNKISGYIAQQNLLLGRELEKNNAKLSRSRANVEQLESLYKADARAFSECLEQWNAEWKLSCDRLQQLEIERILFFKSNLWAYANAVSTVCVNDDECCETIRLSLEKCDPAKDIADVVTKLGSGTHMQEAPEFTNYLGGFSGEIHEPLQSSKFDPDSSYDDKGLSGRVLLRSQTTDSKEAPIKSQSILNLRTPNLAPDPDNENTFSSPTYSSPLQGTSSPHSSIYSSNTSLSNQSPQIDTPSELKHSKRKSWAMPFKRQSSPDLSKVYRHDATSPRLTDQGVQAEVPKPSSDDPLLSALEQLRTGAGQSSASTFAKQSRRRMSMPANSAKGSNPYDNGRPTHTPIESVNPLKPPSRRPPGTGAEQQQTLRARSKSTSSGVQRPHVQLPTRTSNGRPIICYARAQYDYRAAIPEEVSFRTGDIMLVMTMQEDGWWGVEVMDKHRFGLAPSNFLTSVKML